jgi:ribosomal protein S1
MVKKRRKKVNVPEELPRTSTISSTLYKQMELVEVDQTKRKAVLSFLSKPVKKKREKRRSEIEIYVKDAKNRSKTGCWDNATGKTFVGLYAMCHEIVYGFIPTELMTNSHLWVSNKCANSIFVEIFNRDGDLFVEFIKWSWEEEKKKKIWAMRKGVTFKVLDIRSQFSKSLVDRYLANKGL